MKRLSAFSFIILVAAFSVALTAYGACPDGGASGQAGAAGAAGTSGVSGPEGAAAAEAGRAAAAESANRQVGEGENAPSGNDPAEKTGDRTLGHDQSENSFLQGRVNINTASEKELMLIPGMDRDIAANIIQYRENNGPFSSVAELTNVNGVDARKLDEIRYWIKVEGMTDISPDQIRTPQQGRGPMPHYTPPVEK